MIIFGWKIKPIDVLYIDRKEFKTKCEKHKLIHKLIVGKRYYIFQFIPINYFFAKEKVFKICEKCSEDYEEVDDDVEDLLLKYYHKEITINDLNNNLDSISSEEKKILEARAHKDNFNFKNFLKYMVYFGAFIIILILLRYVFKII